MGQADDTTAGQSADQSLRFLFDGADIRGQVVHLAGSLRAITAIHQYAPAVDRLLGEFLAAAVLLASTLKFEGKLILQARSQGQVPLLMVECTSEQEVRGIARGAMEAISGQFDELLAGGHLAITIDPLRGQRYQGVVALERSLASSLETYFRQSEQLATRLWLACDGGRAAGMLLQQMPAQLVTGRERRQQQWGHACTLAATVTEAELLQLAAAHLLHRLFHQDPIRVFAPAPVVFHCSCSRERTLNALAALGRAEVEELLAEMGSITMDCEFCNQRYRFERSDLAGPLGPEEPGTVH